MISYQIASLEKRIEGWNKEESRAARSNGNRYCNAKDTRIRPTANENKTDLEPAKAEYDDLAR